MVAQTNVGISCYSRGDYSNALYWFRKAANQGFDGSQYYLGLMFEHGNGVQKDTTEALKWYRKASEQGVMKDAKLAFMRLNSN